MTAPVTRLRSRRAVVAVAALTAGLLGATLGVVTPAAAADGPTLASGEVRRETGRVLLVGDGDTFRFVPDGGSAGNYKVVRLLGVQAPETKPNTPGQCQGETAHQFLKQLIEGRRVVLASAGDNRDTDHGVRLLRTAYVQLADGTWVDAAEQVLAAGWGQWFPKRIEPVHNYDYRVVADRAASQGLGIWNPELCGTGNDAGVPLRLWVQADPTGNDFDNVNGEYIQIQNQSTAQALDLSGWVIRDGSLNWFRFPSGTSIPAGGVVRLRVGKGQDTDSTFFWGRNRPIFSNNGVTSDYMGDGVYLLDRLGNVRAKVIYPCFGPCANDDPAKGALAITKVKYDAPGNEVGRPNSEFVRITNRGTVAIALLGYEVRIGGWVYDFTPSEILQPGDSVELLMGSGSPAGMHRFMGAPHAILVNSGDRVRLRSLDGHLIDCVAWGSARDLCKSDAA